MSRLVLSLVDLLGNGMESNYMIAKMNFEILLTLLFNISNRNAEEI